MAEIWNLASNYSKVELFIKNGILVPIFPEICWNQ